VASAAVIARIGAASSKVDHADALVRQPARGAQVGEAELFAARQADHDPRRRFAEQGHERVRPLGQDDAGTGVGVQAGLDERLGETALGEIVGRVDQPVARCVDEDVGQQLLAREVDGRRPAAEEAVDRVPLGAAELVAGVAEQVDKRAVLVEAVPGASRDVVDDAQDTDHGGRQDGRVARLVVEADVAAGDRGAQGLAAVGESAHRLGELPHDARILRGAEVEAVRDGERPRAADRDVAVGLGEGELRAGVRVEARVAAVAVGRDGDAALGRLVQPDHARVLGLGQDGVAHDVAVVLVGDPRLVGLIGGRGEP
jgi:hypothetical protein